MFERKLYLIDLLFEKKGFERIQKIKQLYILNGKLHVNDLSIE